jgi:ribosome-binding factor A
MSIRVEKVASLIKQEISAIFTREFSSREYGFITVTDVHMTPDLKNAKIYISILEKGEVRDRTLKMLEDQKKHIRALLGSHIYLKFTPTIQFFFDETLDRVESINNILKKIHQDDRQN